MTLTDCRTDVDSFCSRLPGLLGTDRGHSDTVVVTRAPAVVDVMGGLCESAGGLVLQGALDVAFAAAASAREDGRIALCRMSPDGALQESHYPTDVLNDAAAIERATHAGDGDARNASSQHAVLSLLRALVALPDAAPIRAGVTIIVQSDWPSDAQLDLNGAMLAAVIEAVAETYRLQLDPLAKATLCRTAMATVEGASTGVRGPLAALLGEPGSLLLVRTQPHPSQNALELPERVTIVALDTQLGRPVPSDRHQETHLTALMGLRIIRDLIRADGRAMDVDASHLANVTPTEFVERFRNRIPTKLTGKQFQSKYGDLPEYANLVEPARSYKIRSRTEHVIYENRRVHEFATTIARSRRTRDAAALAHAGELMYGSHWSYSQRCGIGAIETDQIVGALRTAGHAHGFWGAKVTGYGNAGGVVVLMNDEPATHEMLATVLADVQTRTGRRIRIFRGAASGAVRAGARRLGHAPAAAPAPVIASV